MHPETVPQIWCGILRWIQEPLEYEHGSLTPEKIYQRLCGNEWILLIVTHENKCIAAQTIEIVTLGAGRVMNLVTTGGEQLELWQDKMCEVFDTLAKEQGCKKITTRGRIGWLRQLKRNGYTPVYFTAEKEVA